MSDWELIHLTDIHFVREYPTSKEKKVRREYENFAWEILRAIHLGSHDPSTIHALYRHFRKNSGTKNTVTVITGDLTTYGDLESFQQIYEILFAESGNFNTKSGFPAFGLNVESTFVLPGNHDIQFIRQAFRRILAKKFNFETPNALVGFSDCFNTSLPLFKDLTDLSSNYTFNDKPAYLICLNSTTQSFNYFADGLIGFDTLQFVAEKIDQIPDGSLVIVAYHHNSSPIPGEVNSPEAVLHDMALLTGCLSKNRFVIVINGHSHRFSITRINYQHLNENTLIIMSGESTCIDTNGTNNGFCKLIIRDSNITLKKYVYNKSHMDFEFVGDHDIY